MHACGRADGHVCRSPYLVCRDRPPRACHRIDTKYDRNSRRGVDRQDEGKALVPLLNWCLTYTPAPQPKAVSETEEQDLAQLMAKAGQENAEVSGDEDDEEGI